MHIVLYQFRVKQNHEEQFIKAWKVLTLLIHKHEKSLGSRLHKKKDLHYVAYAQWPSKEHFKNAGEKLPLESNAIRARMRDSCEDVKVLDELEVIEDLLV